MPSKQRQEASRVARSAEAPDGDVELLLQHAVEHVVDAQHRHLGQLSQPLPRAPLALSRDDDRLLGVARRALRLHAVPLRPPGFLGDKALAAMKEEEDLARIREEEEMAELAREFEEEMEQRKLMKEFEEEQRQRKAQYEATQKVQAQIKGKQARAEVDAKRKAAAASS